MVFSDLFTTPAAGRTPLLWLVTIPLCTPIIGIRSPKRARQRPRMYDSARMVIRWAPFVNRRLPLVKEPSGTAKWFLKFVGLLRIGWSAMPPSLQILSDVLRIRGLRL